MAKVKDPKEHVYKVHKKAKDPNQAVIRKEGLYSEFTMQEVEDQLKNIKERLSHLRQEKDVAFLMKEKHEEFRPKLKEIPEEEIYVYNEYINARIAMSEKEADMKVLRQTSRDMEKEIKVIKDKLGLWEETTDK